MQRSKKNDPEKVLNILLDADRCTLPSHTEGKNIIKNNTKLINYILLMVQRGGYSHIVFASATNRQSYRIDSTNGILHDNGSFPPQLEILVNYIREKIEKINKEAVVELEKLMLPDIVNNRKFGANFDVIKNEAIKQYSPLYDATASDLNPADVDYGIYDKTKGTLIYTLVQHTKNRFPKSKIHNVFFDDDSDNTIFKNLEEIFKNKHPQLMHEEDSLSLVKCVNDGKTKPTLQRLITIHGTGESHHPDYKERVLAVLEHNNCMKEKLHDVIIFNLGNALSWDPKNISILNGETLSKSAAVTPDEYNPYIYVKEEKDEEEQQEIPPNLQQNRIMGCINEMKAKAQDLNDRGYNIQAGKMTQAAKKIELKTEAFFNSQQQKDETRFENYKNECVNELKTLKYEVSGHRGANSILEFINGVIQTIFPLTAPVGVFRKIFMGNKNYNLSIFHIRTDSEVKVDNTMDVFLEVKHGS